MIESICKVKSYKLPIVQGFHIILISLEAGCPCAHRRDEDRPVLLALHNHDLDNLENLNNVDNLDNFDNHDNLDN